MINKFLKSLMDLIDGRKELVYELTFLLGMINFCIGLVVMTTLRDNHPWHYIAGILIFLSGIIGIITAAVPYEKIRSLVDISCGVTIVYGGIQLIQYGSLRQMSISFLVIYSILYIWKWHLEGAKSGFNKIIK